MTDIPLIAYSDQLMSQKARDHDGNTIGLIVAADADGNPICCFCGVSIPSPENGEHDFDASLSLLVTYPDIILAFRVCTHEHVHELSEFFNSVKTLSNLYFFHISETLPKEWGVHN